MNILFIRHAEAVEPSDWPGDDHSRPLTKAGRGTARRMSAFLAAAGIEPALVLTSAAVRSRETAACAGKHFRRARVEPLLNPGCTEAKMRALLRATAKHELIALIGHEPDFSTIIARLIGDGSARLKLQKSACALIKLADKKRPGQLLWLVPPLPGIGKR